MYSLFTPASTPIINFCPVQGLLLPSLVVYVDIVNIGYSSSHQLCYESSCRGINRPFPNQDLPSPRVTIGPVPARVIHTSHKPVKGQFATLALSGISQYTRQNYDVSESSVGYNVN
jgi:hypothetical protein